MTILAFTLLAFWQAPAAPAVLRDGCSAYDQQIAVIGSGDQVVVDHAIAGGDGTCYQIVVTHDGKSITGYFLGDNLPAIAAFVKEREKTSEVRLEAIANQPLPAPVVAKPAPGTPAAAEKPAPPVPPEIFENFSGHTSNGKVVSLSGMPGRVIVVSFWSAHSGTSKNQLMSMLSVYQQYSRRGLSALGVSMDPNPKHIDQALDDITLTWPQVADPGGLAARYKVDPRMGKIFVLDSAHRIVASGTTIAQLEPKIRELLAQ